MICIVKNDSYSAFIEIEADDNSEIDNSKISDFIKRIEENNEKLTVEKTYNAKKFYSDFKNIIKFN